MATILIVEDDPMNRALLEQLLEDEFEVITAPDGAAGIFGAIDEQPSLILLDLSMPRMGGWAVVETLQSDERTAAIPIMILTGSDNAELRLKAAGMGCAGFISKPYEPEELLAIVRRAVA